jgi:hypothetical protein
MFFEGADGTFGGIDAMVVRWDQLYFHFFLICFSTALEHLLSMMLSIS